MEKIGRTKIVDLLKRTDIGAMVNVKGWVRTLSAFTLCLHSVLLLSATVIRWLG